MKKLLVFLALASLAAPAGSAEKGFGLGIIVGEPTGIGMKVSLDASRAVDAAAAWSFEGDSAFHVHADYLVYPGGGLDDAGLKGRAPFYFGIGGRVRFEGDDHHHGRRNEDHGTRVGLRIPLGIAYLPPAAPRLEFFFEVAPGLDLAPATDLFLNGGAGVRYLFR